jgi:hypothetical protein
MKPTFQRRQFAMRAGALALFMSAPAAFAQSPQCKPFRDPLADILEESMNEKKGVIVYVKGHALTGVVVKVDGDAVHLNLRGATRLVVRRSSIDAVTLS